MSLIVKCSRPGRVGLSLAAALLIACEAPYDEWSTPRRAAPVFRRSMVISPPEFPSSLKVMTWNIKFAGARIDFWFDLWGDRVNMQRDEVEHNLAGIAALIREVDPDILLVQEIEVNARRSAYVDMVAAILEQTSLNYGAYFQSWKSRYVPSEGLGRVDLGNAVFSKYPIIAAQTIAQADRGDLDALTERFYLHRVIGRATIDLGRDQRVNAFVVHTEAYDQDGTKAKHLVQIFDEVRAQTQPFVLAGDFNELPPTALVRQGFPDEHPSSIGTPFEQPPYTPEQMQPFFAALVPAIDLRIYGQSQAEQSRFFSHSVIGPATLGVDGRPGSWNRTLDYIFGSPGSSFVAEQSDVLQHRGRQGIAHEPLLLSDHAPVVARWHFAMPLTPSERAP